MALPQTCGVMTYLSRKAQIRNPELRLNRGLVIKLELYAFAALGKGGKGPSASIAQSLQRIRTRVLCSAPVFTAGSFPARINLLG